MRELPTGSVDLVFGSPPYENRRTYGIGFNLKGQAWVDWAVERYLECLRVCNGLVGWVVEGKQVQFRYTATPILLMADLHRAGVHLRKPPAYKRQGISGSGGPDWLRNDYEFVVCATNGGRLPWSNNTAMGHPPKCPPGGNPSHRKPNGERVNRESDGRVYQHGKHHERRPNGKRGTLRYKPPALSNPGNVIDCGAAGGGNMGHKLCHENEAPFSEKIAEFFIESFCPPGGLVLDPFAGSGTTLAVAQRLGRRYIGFDIRESQIELCRRRLAV
jgi:hypothetical protein